MKQSSFCLIVVVFLASTMCHGAEKTISWKDGMLCGHTIKFDPTKYDEQRLNNTIDVIFVGHFFENLIPAGLGPPNRVSVEETRQACSRTISNVTDLPVIDLPGIEQYRSVRLEQLKDECRFSDALVRAASGEPEALRGYPRSAAQCSKFIDALEGKIDIKAAWRDMINSHCDQNTTPERCRSSFFAVESKPDAADLIGNQVLTYGWQSCSAKYLLVNDRHKSDALLASLENEFRKRFRIKEPPCSD